jgi:hypothetical protein
MPSAKDRNPGRFWIMVAVSFVAFALEGAVGFGAWRPAAFDIASTIKLLAAASGLFWWIGAIIPLCAPDRVFVPAWFNVSAAITALGAAALLAP